VTGTTVPLAGVPLSLYVHVPWCLRKCPYCDFNSHAANRDAIPERAYVDALLRDFASEWPRLGDRSFVSVFIGGGTPSLFSPAAIGRLLEGIDRHVPLGADCEVTLEANPGTHEHGLFRAYRDAGVSRLSLGVQSLDDTMLGNLGRIHDGRQARAALAAALESGFDSVNVDLMFGLPGQSPAMARADLAGVLDFAPPHLSLYQLTLEPNTLFDHQPPAGLPDDDTLAMLQEQLVALLERGGYQRYEVSAYARPGMRCRHNLNYWEFGDYLGIGAGAHSKLSLDEDIVRYAKRRHPADYLATAGGSDAHSGWRRLAIGDRVAEFMLNALRLREGFPLACFEQRTGLPTTEVEMPLAQAVTRGLVELQDGWVVPTPRGFRFLNDLQLLFT